MSLRATSDAFGQALILWEAGSDDAAALLFQRVVNDDPDHGRAWEYLGLAAWRRGDLKKTLTCLETASLLVPLRPEAMCGLAECYAAQRRLELAHLLYHRAVRDQRSSVGILLMAAAGADAIDAPSLSLVACRRALQLEPEAAQAYYDMGYYLGRLGRPHSMIEAAARRAIHLAPDHVQYRLGLASFLHTHGRSDEAYEVVRRISARQIRDIGCVCCLERMAGLFESIGDGLRSEWCRHRADDLKTNDEHWSPGEGDPPMND